MSIMFCNNGHIMRLSESLDQISRKINDLKVKLKAFKTLP